MTCAHAGLLDRLRHPGNPTVRGLVENRKLRSQQCEESLDQLVSYRSFFTAIHALECFASRVPGVIARRMDCVSAVSRNSLNCTNKGIQEFVNIGRYLHRIPVPEDELIVKLTARYLLKRPDFLEFSASSNAQVIVRKDSDVWGSQGQGVHTFLFAARKKLLVEFMNWLLEGSRYRTFGNTPIEWIFGDYLKEQGHCDSCEYYPEKFHLTARYSTPLSTIEV